MGRCLAKLADRDRRHWNFYWHEQQGLEAERVDHQLTVRISEDTMSGFGLDLPSHDKR